MEIIVVLVIVASLFYFLKAMFGSRKTPKKEDYFACSSCGAKTKYDARTISAWNDGKRSPKCWNCHNEWIKAQQLEEYSNPQAVKKKGLGCFGILGLLALACIIIIVLVQ